MILTIMTIYKLSDIIRFITDIIIFCFIAINYAFYIYFDLIKSIDQAISVIYTFIHSYVHISSFSIYSDNL